jgi:hypothetical protein
LRTSPFPNPYRRAAPLLACAALCAAGLPGQEPQRLPPPPGFLQEGVAARADDVVRAWGKWERTDRKLEQRILPLPMAEAREQLRRSLGAYLDFLAARGAYAESVAAYIDRESSARANLSLPEDAACQDQIGVLGANLAALQERLGGLRGSSDWLAIRRGVQEQNNQALKLQAGLRENLDVPAQSANGRPAAGILALAYRDSEREIAETLRRLWTAYYQALADAVEQKATPPLTLLRPDGAHPGAPTAQSNEGPPVDVWIYVAGSLQFNGVAEPKRVLLELWTENGLPLGRYRAELPDFHGVKTVDIRLRGARSGGAQTFQIESKDPAAVGQIVLERSDSSEELILTRVVPARSSIPRGRELLRRR